MALAIDAKLRPVGVDHHHGVERGVVGLLVDTHGQHHIEFGRKLLKVGNGGMTLQRHCAGEVLGQHVDAEIRTLKQLRNHDDLGAT